MGSQRRIEVALRHAGYQAPIGGADQPPLASPLVREHLSETSDWLITQFDCAGHLDPARKVSVFSIHHSRRSNEWRSSERYQGKNALNRARMQPSAQAMAAYGLN